MPLGKEDWINAGFRALATGGPATVKVEMIARELGTTKGSFYWHFKDQAALKTAMLEVWQAKATVEVSGPLKEITSSAAKIEALAEAAAKAPDDAFGGSQIEAAIRDWGHYDPAVRAAIENVDSRRLEFTTSLFAGLSLAQGDARTRGALFYSAYVGLLHRGALSTAEPGQRLVDFARMLIG